MTYTTNYNLNIVEGTDIVNPLTQLNPNFTSVDSIMKNNADASVTPATCIKSGTVHTVTRTNTDAEMFVFTATGDWNSGDTMTVDGTPVSPVLPDGTGLLAGSYLINAEVLCSIKGTKVTVYSNKYNIGADIIDNLTSTATNKALSANQGKVLNEKVEESLAYQAGDTVSLDNIYCNGFYENNGQLRFNIPFSKLSSYVSGATITLTKCEVICAGTDTEQKNNISSTGITRREPNQIMVIASGTFGSVTTRTAAVVIISGDITFS